MYYNSICNTTCRRKQYNCILVSKNTIIAKKNSKYPTPEIRFSINIYDSTKIMF